MVLRVSKSDKNRGKPFWKCLTSYVSSHFQNMYVGEKKILGLTLTELFCIYDACNQGATSCNGFEWVDVTSAEADQQADTYDATVLNMLKSIKDLVLVLLVVSIVILFVLLMTN